MHAAEPSSVQRFGYGTRASLAKFQSILGEITRLALDIVQLADVAQRIFGNLASTGDMQVIELTAAWAAQPTSVTPSVNSCL